MWLLCCADSRLACREGGRGSVFHRLNRKGDGEPSDRARMRMDSVPAERIDDVTVDPTPHPP